jgi:hypothetical protein
MAQAGGDRRAFGHDAVGEHVKAACLNTAAAGNGREAALPRHRK